jgi:hypothetical protein
MGEGTGKEGTLRGSGKSAGKISRNIIRIGGRSSELLKSLDQV